MKVRDSGMPEEEMWSGFFDPLLILPQMEVSYETHTIVDLGCDFGTFSIPTAKVVSGKVLAYDIDEEMIELMKTKINQLGINNIELHQSDFIANGTGLPANSVDYVMIFNILHHDHPEQILSEVFRILKKDAKAGTFTGAVILKRHVALLWQFALNRKRAPIGQKKQVS